MDTQGVGGWIVGQECGQSLSRAMMKEAAWMLEILKLVCPHYQTLTGIMTSPYRYAAKERATNPVQTTVRNTVLGEFEVDGKPTTRYNRPP
eukprot:m.75921 g.75921  ORF g.75921 m.75921 type:complete len:91 (-) comp10469_c0_seq1:181-453(-)